MVTSIHRSARTHLYIDEWMEAKGGLSYQQLGERLGVSRTTAWRWSREQHRLDPQKIANLAHALGLEHTQDLYRLPHRPSIDAILQDAPDEIYEATVELARRLTRKAS